MRLVFCIGLVSSLGACSETQLDDLRAYVDEVEHRTPARVAPLPEVVVYEGYRYGSENLRDPFKPSFRDDKVAPVVASGIGGPDLNRKRFPLEEYPLDTLRLMGSMQQGDDRWGLIKSPQGELFRVRLGEYIGQDHGKVIGISDSEIKLRELIPDGLGNWEERITSLALSE